MQIGCLTHGINPFKKEKKRKAIGIYFQKVKVGRPSTHPPLVVLEGLSIGLIQATNSWSELALWRGGVSAQDSCWWPPPSRPKAWYIRASWPLELNIVSPTVLQTSPASLSATYWAFLTLGAIRIVVCFDTTDRSSDECVQFGWKQFVFCVKIFWEN